MADNICSDIPSPSIHPSISGLCRNSGIQPEFINGKFNQWDFQYWKYATFFNELARSITCNVDNEDAGINEIFTTVRKQIEPIEPPKGNILWPYNIWHLKKGVCDRQAWVLCELVYQLGYETQIVYLRNPKTLESPHTICELRKGGKVWLADPFSDNLLSNTSVADLAANPELIIATWPNEENWQQAVKKSAYWLPSYPQDYCPRNQILHSKLAPILVDNCPRFGESPTHRLKKYLSLTSEKDRCFPYDFWFYPFRLLQAEIKRAGT